MLASTPGRLPSSLGLGRVGPDSTAGSAGIWPSVVARRLGLPLVDQGILSGGAVTLFVIGLQPRGTIFQVGGEDGVGPID